MWKRLRNTGSNAKAGNSNLKAYKYKGIVRLLVWEANIPPPSLTYKKKSPDDYFNHIP